MTRLCDQLHRLFQNLPLFRFPFDKTHVPQNGLYVLFEKGESGHGTSRIVRIGTHTGDNQLRSRLEQHFIKENKDRSIFRKNIGRALLNKDNDPFQSQWELDLTSRKAKDQYGVVIDTEKQRETEKRVTEYIQNNFSFVIFQVDDKNSRLTWESRIISTVSLCDDCGPSDKWLGLHSPKDRIRRSGLWIVNELYKQPLSREEFATLRKACS